MRPRDIEIWAVQVLEQIDRHAPHETSLVELKADWTDPEKSARRIAGHANAARGNEILWLFGVDEKLGIVGTQPTNLATWYSDVRSHFDQGIAPEIIDVRVEWQAKQVFALGMMTDRAPYVVRNPRFGQQGGGAVALEVPWRQGTAVSSATRTQLLLILSASTKLPGVEVLESQLAVVRDKDRESWNLSMLLYVTPATSDRVVIAGHRVSATHETVGGARVGPYSGASRSCLCANTEANSPASARTTLLIPRSEVRTST